MNGRNKKFLDNAFFLASASDFKHPLDRYPGDHHTVIFYLPFSDLGSPDPDLATVFITKNISFLSFCLL